MKPSESSSRCVAAACAAIVVIISALIGCGNDGDAPDGGTGGLGGSPNRSSGGAVGSSGGSDATPAELTDAEIFRVLECVNNGEVEQAKVALLRSQRADVKDLAQTLSDDHFEAVAQVTALTQKQAIMTKGSNVATTFEAKSRVLVEQLTSSPDQGFDSLYLESEVSVHEQALVLIDALASGADDAALKTLILDLKTVESAHVAEINALLP